MKPKCWYGTKLNINYNMDMIPITFINFSKRIKGLLNNTKTFPGHIKNHNKVTSILTLKTTKQAVNNP